MQNRHDIVIEKTAGFLLPAVRIGDAYLAVYELNLSFVGISSNHPEIVFPTSLSLSSK